MKRRKKAFEEKQSSNADLHTPSPSHDTETEEETVEENTTDEEYTPEPTILDILNNLLTIHNKKS